MRKQVLLLLLLLVPGLFLAQESVAPGDVSTTTGDTVTNDEEPTTDETSTPSLPSLERVQLGFKSLYFTTIPLSAGILLFMYLVNRRDGRDKFAPFFGEGQFLQLVVIVMVAGNVCSLAIMGILGKSEISAIYGGIVGYVLGRRTSTPPTPGSTSNPDTPAAEAPVPSPRST